MADIPAGSWGTLSFKPPTSDFQDILTPINSAADFITAALDVALQTLNLVKTVLKSYLDPIVALVQAIVDELEALARSLEGIGVYFSGDWELLGYPFTDLKGGFANYERRMVARFTDRTDPTRPNVSEGIQTYAGFFYMSVEGSEVHRLLSFMSQIQRFFNLSSKPKSHLPRPTITNVLYGTDATNILNFDSLVNLVRFDPTPPSVARVTWKVTPPTTDNPYKPFPSVPPKHFLITVSTIPDGIKVMFDRPRSDTDTKEAQGGENSQPREYGPVLDRGGVPVVLYGGSQMVAFDEATFGWNSSIDDKGNVKPNRARVYGILDAASNFIFPLEEFLTEVQEGETQITGSGSGKAFKTKALWQRTFTTDEIETSVAWASDELSIDLRLEDMPYHATVEMENGKAKITDIHRPSTYYVRVATTGPDSIDSDKEEVGLRNRFVYDFESEGAKANATTSGHPFVVNVGKPEDAGKAFTLSAWSNPEKITFSGSHTREYLDAVRASLALLVLCRVDLPVIDDLGDLFEESVLEAAKKNQRMLPGVALKRTNLEQFRHLLGFIYSDPDSTFRSRGVTPKTFRKDLYDRVTQVATDLYQTTGPLPAEEAVVKATKTLRSIKWSEIFTGFRGGGGLPSQVPSEAFDATILESLGENGADGYPRGSSNEDGGLALNPYCMGVEEGVVSSLFNFFSFANSPVFRDRSPHFIELETYGGAQSSEWKLLKNVPAAEVPAYLDSLPSGLKMLYEYYIASEDKVEKDTNGNEITRYKKGDIAVEEEAASFWSSLQELHQVQGSADLSPVFYRSRQLFTSEEIARKSALGGLVDISYVRTILAEYNGGQLMQEASFALGVAASAHQRAPQDGAWLSVRVGDLFPGLDSFFDSILNWVKAVQAATNSVADTLLSYIDYVEARIIEFQQLIRRINSMLQMAFSFSFSLPKVSGLVLASKGTDGVLSDFLSATDKPQDSSQAYGAGLVLVAPSFPSFLVDLFPISDVPPEGTMGSSEDVPTIFGIEGLTEEQLNPPSDPEPDVL